MRWRRSTLVLLTAAAAVAGCHRHEPAAQPSEAATGAPTAAPSIAPSALPGQPSGAALDTGAIHDRTSPVRLLRFYAAALSVIDTCRRRSVETWGYVGSLIAAARASLPPPAIPTRAVA